MTPQATSTRRVLADVLAPSITSDVALVLGGAALVGALAQVSIPLGFTPVPVTGQTLGVLLVGATLGTRRASVSLALYLVAGLAGVPWFAGHTSHVPFALVGYLVGFLAAAALTGALGARYRGVLATTATMIAGEAAIYAVAVPWLALALHVGLARALSLGMWPFLAGDALKALIAGVALPGAWRLVSETRHS